MGVIKCQNCLYGRSHLISYNNFLRFQLFIMPQVYYKAYKKTWAQNEKSQICNNKKVDRANLDK